MKFLNLPSPLWVEIRTLIGRAACYSRYESGNEVVPHLRFGRIDGFDSNDAQKVQIDLMRAFGHNGTPPPLPHLDESVADYVSRVTLWLHRHDIGATETSQTLQAFNNGA
jgi:hypothetical protein